MPWAFPLPRRARHASTVLLSVLGAVFVGLHWVGRHSRAHVEDVCHPNLSHLRSSDGKEVLLIGTLPLDLDGESGQLVRRALAALRPDIIMVEGSWATGVTAMVTSGQWVIPEVRSQPASINWTDLADAEPVELVRPVRRRGWFSSGRGEGMRLQLPEKSLVPVKVDRWAFHLRGSVGGDVAAAVAIAAASRVPLHFLGPPQTDSPGHMQVNMLALRAASELLEEESRRGSALPTGEMNLALQRAEAHVRQDSSKWLTDARGDIARAIEHLYTGAPEGLREAVLFKLEEQASNIAIQISAKMEGSSRGAVVLAVHEFVGVETKLKEVGYQYISACT